ncbi:hypothetical protein DMH18_33455 [Streptomyces sp. WAC 06783]|uniref:hypothetical protein n=1 Tax=Streptomyces sp. WAC 06783 TaxID=2203211 RepID=UPI001000E81F|nr:hypothetical protein [Streptomyces sp. WAC 06783]RSO04796.1 hypothetical protein DMH18_33455 [Streptomyces sp. WAC 06783]
MPRRARRPWRRGWPPARRRPLTGPERYAGLPLVLFAVAVVIAIVPATGACALAGTDAPFLVNARGPAKGPAPAAARIGAGVPCLLFLAGIGVFVRKVMLRGLAPRTPPSTTAACG